MLFVVDRLRLLRMIAIVQGGRKHGDRAQGSAFMRLEAADGGLRLTGHRVEARVSAMVYEAGVLFAPAGLLRDVLSFFNGERQMALQVDGKALIVGNVRLDLQVYDMLLYPEPATAPATHPADRLARAQAEVAAVRRRGVQPNLPWDARTADRPVTDSAD